MHKFCVVIFIVFTMLFSTTVFGADDTNFYSKVYALEKSIGNYYDVLEFNGSAEESEPSGDMDEAVFLSDLKNSYESRKHTIDRFVNFKSLEIDDYWLLREIGVLAEKNFCDKYRDNLDMFENMRYKVLCETYLLGWDKQYQAVKDYAELKNSNKDVQVKLKDTLAHDYVEGCILRESVLFELNKLYDFDIDVENFVVREDFDHLVENVKAKEYSNDLVLNVQKKLNELGYDCGKEDGIIGANTIFAIYDYQRYHGLEMNGEITKDLLDSLGVGE